MAFVKIDYDNWPRREIHEIYGGTVIRVTVQVEITDFLTHVRKNKHSFYPAVMHCLLKVANADPAYRHGYDAHGNVGIWDIVHPVYTVPRAGHEDLFSLQYTPYSEDFSAFESAYSSGLKARTDRLILCDDIPDNQLHISAMPGLHFSSLALDSGAKDNLTPFFVIGKYAEEDERVLLPISGEFAHSVNDGVHISRFFEQLTDALSAFDPA